MIKAILITYFLFSFYFVIGQQKKEKTNITQNDTATIVKANASYKANKIKKFFFGKHYRKEWATPVKAPIFDLKKSGLSVIKKGGSRQTINLRLQDSTGRQYVLRSVDKKPINVLPPKWRNTFIANIFQDQTSSAHPYSALTIPTMANAVGVYHTNPILVYVPQDSTFGEFTNALAKELAIFEERPNGPMSDVSSMGNPPNVIGTEKMLKKRIKDNDFTIDERQYARSRLFDMLIGDWSRHEDQWRWGEFPLDKGKLYKPIPRDRDHAYFKFDGLLPSLASMPWGKRHLTNFGYKLNNLKGLGYSASHMDKMILTSLTEKGWIEIADSIKMLLTNNIIDSAIREMPENVFQVSGPELIAKLKCRREQLPRAARKYYKLLAKKVDVYGSNKHELFQVNRLNNGATQVKVFKINKEGEIKKLIYERVFFKNETKEVRLLGLGGEDKFDCNGKVKKGIKIVFIAGEGDDNVYGSFYAKKGLP